MEMGPTSSGPLIEDDFDELLDLPTFAYSTRVVAIIGALLSVMQPILPEVSIRAFGSAVNGFGEDSSDVDVVVAARKADLRRAFGLSASMSKKGFIPGVLEALVPLLRRRGFQIKNKILHAKIPILKMTLDGVECDLSINNLLPVFNTRLLLEYAEIDPRSVELVRMVKKWAKLAGVHGASDGNLSSYSFTLLVLFYMQVRGALPCLQRLPQRLMYRDGSKSYNVAMDLESWKQNPPPMVPCIGFKDFFRFYSEEFRYGEEVVSVRLGRPFPVDSPEFQELRVVDENGFRPDKRQQLIHIEDPFDTARNLNIVLQSGINHHRLLTAFRDAHRAYRVNEVYQAESRSPVNGHPPLNNGLLEPRQPSTPPFSPVPVPPAIRPPIVASPDVAAQVFSEAAAVSSAVPCAASAASPPTNAVRCLASLPVGQVASGEQQQQQQAYPSQPPQHQQQSQFQQGDAQQQSWPPSEPDHLCQAQAPQLPQLTQPPPLSQPYHTTQLQQHSQPPAPEPPPQPPQRPLQQDLHQPPGFVPLQLQPPPPKPKPPLRPSSEYLQQLQQQHQQQSPPLQLHQYHLEEAIGGSADPLPPGLTPLLPPPPIPAGCLGVG
mmetsp:Transcript_22006/g.48082  ORF Transcript_22006/g.48082 Transcript_22006/m.48082 type:complete len:603 (-) Transcript_22006:84-1892(-)